MNKVILKGNLARDPDIKVLDIGSKKISVANFTIAVSRFFRKANGEADKDTMFINCEAWDSGAETIGQYLKKGDPVLLEGSLKSESWEKDGQKMSRMKVRVSKFEKLYRASVKEQESEKPLPEETPNNDQF